MAESMKGLKRTHRCAELSAANVGEKVTIMGWVQKNRNKGGLVFVDVRDRSGIIQVVFEEGKSEAALIEKAAKLRAEYVVAIVGTVAKRSGAVNDHLATGEIEVIPEELRILSESETPPFHIEENSKTKEEVRLKYRYLDLRRPDLQRNLMMRSKVATLTRQFLAEEGFLEIETPVLIKSTPEGARDYLVPSRIQQGQFYALPQSPQLFKQLLMCSGYDRYFQIAKCFRDEDLRADRQPEFTQIDMELSFVDVDDVIEVNEKYLKKLFKEVLDVDVQLPIQRMTWQEAMDRFGSDKPDIRFGMELTNVTDVVKDCEFVVFKNAIENGGTVRGINAKGQGGMARKKIDKLVDFAKDYGAKGLAYIAIHEDGTVTLDSDFLEMAVEGKTSFSAKGKEVALDIENCDVHLQNLGSEFADTKFVVSEIPAEGEAPQLNLYGESTGNTIELQPTTQAYIDGKVASKADFTELFEKNLLDNQSICDASGNFIGYYGLVLNGVNDLSVKVITIENKDGSDANGHTQYYESKLTKEGQIFKLDTPVEQIKSVNGATYAFKAIDCTGDAVAVDGMSNVTLTSNKGAVNDFDYVTSGGKFTLGKAQDHGAACDEIWAGTGGQATSSGGTIADINAMSYDFGWSGSAKQRPLVIWTWWFANLAFPSSEEGASILMNNSDKDRVLFKNISGSGQTCGGGTLNATEVAEISAYCKDLIDTWFNEKGLFVVRHDRQSAGDKFYIYLLCPDTEATSKGGMWMKYQRD